MVFKVQVFRDLLAYSKIIYISMHATKFGINAIPSEYRTGDADASTDTNTFCLEKQLM